MEYGAIIGGVLGGIITIIGYFLVAKWQIRKTEEINKLIVHFKDIKGFLDAKLLPMARSFKVRGNQVYYDGWGNL